jgi:hypothetical protein
MIFTECKKRRFHDNSVACPSYSSRSIHPMKISKTILTHAAVFAVGVSLAMVAKNSSSAHSDENAAAGNEATTRSGRISGSGSESFPATMREGRDTAMRTPGKSLPSVERLGEICRIGDPLERQAALMDLIKRLGPDEFAAVAEQYRKMDRYGDSRGEYDLILRGWAHVDPMGALDYTTNQSKNRGETSLVLSAWAGKDAAAAERWALEHHEGDGPNPWLAAVVRGIAAYDINHASELVRSMPSSRERGEAMDAVTRALLVQGADVAMAYPDTIQDSHLRTGFISQIAERLASKDPDKAASWLASISDADSQNRASRRVGEALAKQDPAAAAKWLPTLKPEAQAEAARGIIPVMSSGDIAGTARWVSSLAGMPNYDRVVEEFVWSCDYRHPEQSAAWIQGVSDPAQQTRLYHRMLGEWAKRDLAAVKNWVANNDVPATVTKRFK